MGVNHGISLTDSMQSLIDCHLTRVDYGNCLYLEKDYDATLVFNGAM